MPWKRAKALPPPDNTLFEACFRIAREAGCPLVVENVKGAQPWVGRAAWHYGSFYLWGDVPALMPVTRHRKSAAQSPGKVWGDRPPDSQWSGTHGLGNKNSGGSWFNVAHNTESGVGQNPVNGVKVPSASGRRTDIGKGARFTSRDCGVEGVKGMSGLRGFSHPDGNGVSDLGGPNDPRRFASKSHARKAASAAIAEIPFDLAQWIAKCFKPVDDASHDELSGPLPSQPRASSLPASL